MVLEYHLRHPSWGPAIQRSQQWRYKASSSGACARQRGLRCGLTLCAAAWLNRAATKMANMRRLKSGSQIEKEKYARRSGMWQKAVANQADYIGVCDASAWRSGR